VTVTVTETITSLELADALREGQSFATPFDLWLAAKYEAGGDRLTLFRHALIHAGYLVNSKGNAYRQCPLCHERLAR
jgi:hypothetical protein